MAEPPDRARVLFPVDSNSTLACMDACYRTHGEIWVMVVPKRPVPDVLDEAQSRQLASRGLLRLVGSGAPEEKLLLVAVGSYQLAEVLRASKRLAQHAVAHAVVVVVEPGRLKSPHDSAQAAATRPDEDLAETFPGHSEARIVVSHTRPESITGVLRRIDTISSTSNKIMSGNLSERVPVTGRNDEFDALATNLNLMLDRIEQLMQGMKEVTDNVAHDLKTPLTRLRNKAESALRDGQNEATRKQALETTIEESDKLIKTFNALLMIARAEAGTPSGALSEIDLSAVVLDVAELYGPLAEDQGLALETDIDEGVRINGNRELLGQALVNLIENALKYYEPSEGKAGLIKVSLKRAGARVRIEVTDNGPGIPAEDRGRVVERFVRLEKSRTEPGSGLGLSLVAAVAQLHKGELRLEDNAPGVRAVVDLPG